LVCWWFWQLVLRCLPSLHFDHHPSQLLVAGVHGPSHSLLLLLPPLLCRLSSHLLLLLQSPSHHQVPFIHQLDPSLMELSDLLWMMQATITFTAVPPWAALLDHVLRDGPAAFRPSTYMALSAVFSKMAVVELVVVASGLARVSGFGKQYPRRTNSGMSRAISIQFKSISCIYNCN
jgi:hypothetical protein